MAVVITSDFSQLDEVLNRFSVDLPSYRGVAHLENVLDRLFEETQRDVHVITGSLRASGKTSSNVREHVWTGEIIYGGSAPGFPRSPVEYAVYERARGGSHDFLSRISVLDDAFREAVLSALRGD